MSIESFVTGFPRVGPKREYKWAVEKFWKSEITENEFLANTDSLEYGSYFYLSLLNKQIGDEQKYIKYMKY